MVRYRVGKSLVLAAAAMSTLGLIGTSPADAGSEYRVLARIRTGTALEGKGDYRETMRGATLIQKWNIEVNFARPNTSYSVLLNGNSVGKIRTNALGHAEQEFRSVVVDNNPRDQKPPIPTGFPHVNVGDTFTIVGVGTGSFARR